VEPSSAPWRVLEPVEPEPAAGPPPSRRPSVAALAAIALVAILAISAFLLASRDGTDIAVDGAATYPGASGSPGAPTGASPGGTGIVVEVGGAVEHPGVYRLPAGSRVGDAIAAAGGFAPSVDAVAADARLNLAAVLHDADKVRVPSRGDVAAASGAATAGGTGAGGAAPAGPVDLNTATAAELDALPGVGPATAAKIIGARPFTSVEDLVARKVLGSAALAKIRALVTIGR
jgi:competence protein ComEA